MSPGGEATADQRRLQDASDPNPLIRALAVSCRIARPPPPPPPGKPAPLLVLVRTQGSHPAAHSLLQLAASGAGPGSIRLPRPPLSALSAIGLNPWRGAHPGAEVRPTQPSPRRRSGRPPPAAHRPKAGPPPRTRVAPVAAPLRAKHHGRFLARGGGGGLNPITVAPPSQGQGVSPPATPSARPPPVPRPPPRARARVSLKVLASRCARACGRARACRRRAPGFATRRAAVAALSALRRGGDLRARADGDRDEGGSAPGVSCRGPVAAPEPPHRPVIPARAPGARRCGRWGASVWTRSPSTWPTRCSRRAPPPPPPRAPPPRAASPRHRRARDLAARAGGG